jgi:hypothetical protein
MSMKVCSSARMHDAFDPLAHRRKTETARFSFFFDAALTPG